MASKDQKTTSLWTLGCHKPVSDHFIPLFSHPFVFLIPWCFSSIDLSYTFVLRISWSLVFLSLVFLILWFDCSWIFLSLNLAVLDLVLPLIPVRLLVANRVPLAFSPYYCGTQNWSRIFDFLSYIIALLLSQVVCLRYSIAASWTRIKLLNYNWALLLHVVSDSHARLVEC